MPIALRIGPDGRLQNFQTGEALLIDEIDRLGTGDLTIGASLGALDELILGSISSLVHVLGDLDVDGIATASGFLGIGQAANPIIPGANNGTFWTQTGAPSLPMFTDSADVDFVLNSFLGNSDTPSSFAGLGNHALIVNPGATAVTTTPGGQTIASDATTGVLDGGLITAGAGAGQVSVSDGSGRIIDYTAPGVPSVVGVSWSGLTNIAITAIATTQVTFLLIDSGGSLVQVSGSYPTEVQRRANMYIGYVTHFDNSTVGDIISKPALAYGSSQDFKTLVDDRNGVLLSGAELSPNGANLSLDISGGTLFDEGINFHTSKSNPSVLTFAGGTLVTFDRIHGDGTHNGETTQEALDTTVVDPANYDDGGSLTSVGGTASRATIQRVYLDGLGNLYVAYGQVFYNNLASAVTDIGNEPFVESAFMHSCRLLCRIAVTRSATDLSDDAQAVFYNEQTGAGSGGGTVNTGDVVGPSSATDNAIAVFDGTTGKQIKNSSATVDPTTGRLDLTHAVDDTTVSLAIENTGTNPGKANFLVGDRDPEGNVTADPGSFYLRINGTSSTFYQLKAAANGNTPWVDVGAGPVAGPDGCLLGHTGLLEGGQLTVNGTNNDEFDISAGSGWLVDHTDPTAPVCTLVTWGAIIGTLVTNIATSTSTGVGIQAGPTVIQKVNGLWTDLDYRTTIVLGFAVHPDNATLQQAGDAPGAPANNGHLSYVDFIRRVTGPANIEGNVFSANGTNLSLDKSSGQSYSLGTNFHADPRVPDVSVDATAIAPAFFEVYRHPSNPLELLPVNPIPQTTIDPNQYDNSGVLTAVASNDWQIKQLYWTPAGAGLALVAYGQETFNTLTDAEAAFFSGDVSFEERPQIRGALHRGYLFVREGATDLSDTAQAVFREAPKFRLGGVFGGGGGGGTADPSAIHVDVANEISGITAKNTPADGDLVVLEDSEDSFNKKSMSFSSWSIPGIDSGASTGLTDGGVLAVGAGGPGVATTFTITDGFGYVVDTTTTPGTPTRTRVAWSSLGEIAVTALGGSNVLTYVCINSAGSVIQKTTSWTPDEFRTCIILGVIVHVDPFTTVTTVNQEQITGYNVGSTVADIFNVLGFINHVGNVFSGNIGTADNLQKDFGTMFGHGINYDNSALNPNYLDIAAAGTGALDNSQFQYRLSDGSSPAGPDAGFGLLTNESVSFGRYESSTAVLSDVPNNQWSVQRIFIFTSGAIKVQYGQHTYSSADAAIAGIEADTYVTEPSFSNGLLRSFLVVEEGATDLTNPAQAQFIEANKFGTAAGGSGGGGGGTDSDAIHVNVANEISGITAKTVPVLADLFVIEDSADSFNKKSLSYEDLISPTPVTVVQDYLQVTNTLSTDVNVLVTDNIAPMDTVTGSSGTHISHDAVNDRVDINTTGTYTLAVTLSYGPNAIVRWNGRVKFRINGVTVLDPRGKSGYMRGTTGADESSTHLFVTVPLTSGDYVEVLVDRESTPTGVVNLSPSESVFAVRAAFFTTPAFVGPDHGTLAGLADDDHLQYLRTDGTRALSATWAVGDQAISNARWIGFNGEYDAGNSGAALLIDFDDGQKQRVTLTANAALTFSFPAVGNYVLKIIQDGTGNWVPTTPALIKAGDADLRVKLPAGAITIWAIYWDGSEAHTSFLLNSQTAVVTGEA